MQVQSIDRLLHEELVKLHGGVRVTLEEATVTGNLPLVENNLREIESRLSRLIARPSRPAAGNQPPLG